MASASGRHIRAVMAAGVADSVGLALGWTVFNLIAVERHGLAVAATYNAAMLVGIGLAAPVTAGLTGRRTNRFLVRSCALIEVGLRVLAFVTLLGGAPAAVTALVVLALNVVAWTGYAGMRAEVAGAPDRAAALSRYASLILAAEAAGASLAALLPFDPAGGGSQAVLVAVVAVYACSLLPTVAVAAGATVAAAPAHRPRVPSGHDRQVLLTGGLVMAMAAGPALLYVVLADRLHGRGSVAVAAIAFTAGSLLSPSLAARFGRLAWPPTVALPWIGAAMAAGWIVAPWSVVGLGVAQFASGLALTAFEGTMDAGLVGDAVDGDVTNKLAQASAVRAVGGAASVRLVPLLVPAVGVGAMAVTMAGGAVVAALVADVARPIDVPDPEPA